MVVGAGRVVRTPLPNALIWEAGARQPKHCYTAHSHETLPCELTTPHTQQRPLVNGIGNKGIDGAADFSGRTGRTLDSFRGTRGDIGCGCRPSDMRRRVFHSNESFKTFQGTPALGLTTEIETSNDIQFQLINLKHLIKRA